MADESAASATYAARISTGSSLKALDSSTFMRWPPSDTRTTWRSVLPDRPTCWGMSDGPVNSGAVAKVPTQGAGEATGEPA